MTDFNEERMVKIIAGLESITNLVSAHRVDKRYRVNSQDELQELIGFYSIYDFENDIYSISKLGSRLLDFSVKVLELMKRKGVKTIEPFKRGEMRNFYKGSKEDNYEVGVYNLFRHTTLGVGRAIVCGD